MGNSTIYKWPFSIAMLNYQRVVRTSPSRVSPTTHNVSALRMSDCTKPTVLTLTYGNSRILKWRYCTIFLAIFCGDIPLHRPYIGLIYGRYLQFRILEWPSNWGGFVFFRFKDNLWKSYPKTMGFFWFLCVLKTNCQTLYISGCLSFPSDQCLD